MRNIGIAGLERNVSISQFMWLKVIFDIRTLKDCIMFSHIAFLRNEKKFLTLGFR